MGRRLDERKKANRKKERDERVAKRRERIREENRVKRELEKIRYQERERLTPIRNKKNEA